MKKVLIITYLPYASPRVPGLAKYLPEFGWQPVVLTRRYLKETEPTSAVIETSYRESLSFLRRLAGMKPGEDDLRRGIRERLGAGLGKSLLDPVLTIGGAILNYPDDMKGWQPFALSEGRKLLQSGDIAAIVSSSSPVTSHIIAGRLKTEYRVPWLADLRDLWSQNHNYRYGAWRRMVDRRLERKTLARADALVTVSRPWAEKLGALHQREPAEVITNGFDPEEMNTPPAGLTVRFTITHTGTIYRGKQDATKILVALRDLVANKTVDPDKIEVRFYGPVEGWFARQIEEYGLSRLVSQYGMVPRPVALQKQRESQLLLLLDWDDPQEKGVYPAKVFEYLAAMRPILATGGIAGNVIDRLLDETRAGSHALGVEDIKKELIKQYQQYETNGSVAYQVAQSAISQYTQRSMAQKFAEILDRLA